MWNRKKTYTWLCLLPYVVYSMRGGFYTSGGTLSRSMVLVVMLMGLYFTAYCMVHYYNRFGTFMKCHLFMVLFAMLSWLLSDGVVYGSYVGRVTTLDFMKNFLYPNLSFYTFYFLNKKFNLSAKTLLTWAVLIGIGTYFNMLYERATRLSALTWEAESTQIALGYTFAIMIPYAYFIKRPYLRMAVAFVLFLITVFSAKRGAMVLGAMLLVVCYYYTFMIGNKWRKGKMLFMGLAVAVIGVFFAWNYISQNDFVMNRLAKMEEGDASGRDVMYARMIDYCLNLPDVFKFLFGGGVIHTVRVIGDYAHNDWLESFIDFGIFYTMAYFAFLVGLFREARRAKTEYRYIILSVALGLVFKSILSMGIYSMDQFLNFMLLVCVFTSDYKVKPNIAGHLNRFAK